MRPAIILSLVLALGACTAPDDLDKKILESPEDLAAIAPIARAPGKMLPSSVTTEENEARIKADGWDPRDQNPSYAFTAAPGDVLRLPAESEPVKALLIGYSDGASDLLPYFVDLIAAASEAVSKVIVYVPSSYVAQDLLSALSYASVDTSNVSFLKLNIDTVWMRDYGPLLVKTKTGGTRVIDLRYYYGRWNDDVVPTKLAAAWKVPVSRPPLEAEGGNLQSDGAGTCITTRQLVHQNPGYTDQDVRSVLKSYLGCQSTLILPTMDGEGTGHVDMYVTITGPKQALVGQYSPSDDPYNAKIVDQGAAMLAAAGFKVIRVPMPANSDGAFRSYTNSLAVGSSVLLPVYLDDRRYESQAVAAFKKAYPGRTIIPIDSTDVIQWAGAIHCVTMTLGQ